MPTWSVPKKAAPCISYVFPIISSSTLRVSNRFSSLSANCFEVLCKKTHTGPQNKECTSSRSNSQPDDGYAAIHFSACYDDDCYIYRSAKDSFSGRGWFPRKPRQNNPEPVIDKTRQQMISAISLYTMTSKPALNVKILGKNGKIPKKGSNHAAGYDIYSSETISIPPKERKPVTTDIAIAIPTGTYA